MTYAHVIDGQISKLGPRPTWRIGDTQEDSRLLTDEELAALPHYWFRVADAPEHDPEAQKLVEIPQAEWAIGDGVVGPQFRVEPLTADELADRLTQHRLAKWEQVKAQRDACIDAGTTVPGIGPFDSNLTSRININGAVSMAQIAQAGGVPFEISWTMADNTVAVLDAPTMIAAGMAVGQHVSSCHEVAQAFRSQIEAALDRATLDAIDLTQGWPA